MSLADDLRLTSKGIERSGEAVDLRFEGKAITALAGESLAAALTAAGHLDLRQAGSGDRRGIFCGMGACQECLVEIDGRGAQRACMTAVTAGMSVRRHDPATAALAPLGPAASADPPEERCRVAIIGAGPAGLSAAVALAELGLTPVVIDERGAPGGQFYKQLASSHRFRAGGEDRQFAAGRKLIERVHALGVEIRSGHLVWQASAPHGAPVSLAVQAGDRAYVLEADAVLVATGAYERPVHIPGWTLPGVMTTGAAQGLARAYRVTPGKRVLVAGNGPLNWQLALEIAESGGTVVAVLEAARPFHPMHLAAGLAMMGADPGLALAGLGMRIRLAAAGVPLHVGHRVTGIHGEGRVEAAQVHSIRDGSSREIAADAVVLGYGFAPSTEVARLLGVEVLPDQAGYPVPVTDAEGRAPGRSVWLAGDGLGIGGSDVALAQGRVAAESIAAALGARPGDPLQSADARRRLNSARAFQRGLWSLFAPLTMPESDGPATVICRCEGITAGAITALREEGVGDLASLKRRTRLGMGRCQGRYCAAAALRMLRGPSDGAGDGTALFAPQAPTRPVPITVLASEKPEWGGHREVELVPRNASGSAAGELPESCDLLVIGAGIIGVSTALYAAQDGIDTVVIDRLPANSEASGSNAGSLHVQLLSWDFGKKAMAGGSPALNTLPLQRDAVAFWKSLEADLAADFEITTTGGLMVAENADQASFLKEKAAVEAGAGIAVEIIGRAELATLAPAISDRMVIAAYCAAEGKINPLRATPVLVAEALRLGARFAAGQTVTTIAPDGAGYAVTTSRGVIRARRIVIACGGWSRLVGRHLGVELPIHGAPLQMLVTEPTRPLLKQLVAHADRHLTMKQAASGNLVIGGAWTAGTDSVTGYARVLRRSIEGNLWVAERTVPLLSGLHLLRSWAAMNVNIDGAPLLGELPGAKGVFIAASANGYTLGPLLGRFTADLVAGRRRPELDFFTLRRFG